MQPRLGDEGPAGALLLEKLHVLDEVQDVDHVVEDRLEVVRDGPLHEGLEDAAGADVLGDDQLDVLVGAVLERRDAVAGRGQLLERGVAIHASEIAGRARPAKLEMKTLRISERKR